MRLILVGLTKKISYTLRLFYHYDHNKFFYQCDHFGKKYFYQSVQSVLPLWPFCSHWPLWLFTNVSLLAFYQNVPSPRGAGAENSRDLSWPPARVDLPASSLKFFGSYFFLKHMARGRGQFHLSGQLVTPHFAIVFRKGTERSATAKIGSRMPQ